MQIITGKLKGKKLAKYKTSAIRPAMALVRKSIFDTLRDFVEGTDVLDLCAGSGILGIEALSRGAKSLTLVDSDKNAIKLIHKNLNLCNLQAKVILGRLPNVLSKQFIQNKKFDLIFLDPPYNQSNFISKALENILKKEIIKKLGFIIIESELKSNFTIPLPLSIYKEKRYGNTRITMLKC